MSSDNKLRAKERYFGTQSVESVPEAFTVAMFAQKNFEFIVGWPLHRSNSVGNFRLVPANKNVASWGKESRTAGALVPSVARELKEISREVKAQESGATNIGPVREQFRRFKLLSGSRDELKHP